MCPAWIQPWTSEPLPFACLQLSQFFLNFTGFLGVLHRTGSDMPSALGRVFYWQRIGFLKQLSSMGPIWKWSNGIVKSKTGPILVRTLQVWTWPSPTKSLTHPELFRICTIQNPNYSNTRSLGARTSRRTAWQPDSRIAWQPDKKITEIRKSRYQEIRK